MEVNINPNPAPHSNPEEPPPAAQRSVRGPPVPGEPDKDQQIAALELTNGRLAADNAQKAAHIIFLEDQLQQLREKIKEML